MILLSVERYDGSEHFTNMPFLAQNAMSEEDTNITEKTSTSLSIGKDWGTGFGSGRRNLFDNPDDFDIYCDRERGVNYIFHGPELNCTIDHMEYDHDTQRIIVFTNDRQQLDLGTKIQWLVRPYIAKEQYIFVIRTANGKPIDGVEVHLRIKDPEIQKSDIQKTLN